ncbi:hypothetical protein [uncultured Apibacter sp.]|uniref:hypothetical protein n=1 Tax=uncultured Apibacter sp. TaxID=1778616 RepID=UPI0025FF502D|nr:hypothetical protein [uncultured Apibacter sp.]
MKKAFVFLVFIINISFFYNFSGNGGKKIDNRLIRKNDDLYEIKLPLLYSGRYNLESYNDKEKYYKQLPINYDIYNYKFDEHNRIISIEYGSFITDIIYSGDLIAEIKHTIDDNIAREKIVYNANKILVYDEKNNLKTTLTVKNNLLIRKETTNGTDRDIYKYEYDEKGNLIKDYSKLNNSKKIIFNSYSYNFTQKGIFRYIVTPRWIISYIFGNEMTALFSPNLIKKVNRNNEYIYNLIWDDYQAGYPSKVTYKENNSKTVYSDKIQYTKPLQ